MSSFRDRTLWEIFHFSIRIFSQICKPCKYDQSFYSKCFFFFICKPAGIFTAESLNWAISNPRIRPSFTFTLSLTYNTAVAHKLHIRLTIAFPWQCSVTIIKIMSNWVVCEFGGWRMQNRVTKWIIPIEMLKCGWCPHCGTVINVIVIRPSRGSNIDLISEIDGYQLWCPSNLITTLSLFVERSIINTQCTNT